MRSLIIITLSIYSLSIFANVHGTWKGSGTITYPTTRVADCMETTLTFTKRGDKIHFSHDYFICDNVNYVIDDWENNYILKNGNEIWIHDIVHVGKYEPNYVIFAASGQIDEELILEENGRMTYKLWDGAGALVEFDLERK